MMYCKKPDHVKFVFEVSDHNSLQRLERLDLDNKSTINVMDQSEIYNCAIQKNYNDKNI